MVLYWIFLLSADPEIFIMTKWSLLLGRDARFTRLHYISISRSPIARAVRVVTLRVEAP